MKPDERQTAAPRPTSPPAHPAFAPRADGPPLVAIDYADGQTALRGWLALPASAGPAPGVLVAHEAIGLNAHVQARAQALAELGYAAFALDMYGEAFPLSEAMDRHHALMSEPGLLARRARAGLSVLAAQEAVDAARLAALGFCQGGAVALELARAGVVRCAIGFHPGLQRPAGSAEGPIDARVLMLVGDIDPVSPPEVRQAFAEEMSAKGADWELHLFGGVGHTFTNPQVDDLNRPGFAYDARADRRGWAMARRALAEELGPG